MKLISNNFLDIFNKFSFWFFEAIKSPFEIKNKKIIKISNNNSPYKKDYDLKVIAYSNYMIIKIINKF
jgi:hypothetical protein